ncbi:MAG: stalk domain-containing protein [Caulobacteraceae bacterium]
MKKKIMSEVLALFMVCTVMFSAANITVASAADEQMTLKYTDWFFNEDFTKVNIAGKWYPNYITITREDESIYNTGETNGNLRLTSTWADYLTTPFLQKKYTVDEYYEREKAEMGKFEFGSAAFFYPKKEVVYLNWMPWQDCIYKDYYIQAMKDNGKEEYLNIIGEDKKYNGLAAGIFEDKLSFEDAKAKYNIDKMPIYVFKSFLIKNYREYYELTDGEKIEFKQTEDKFASLDDLKKYIKEKSIITVTLHLQSKQMEINQAGITTNVILDTAPVAPNGTTLVPVRAISEAFGSTVEWDGVNQNVTIKKGETVIKLKLGSKIAYVNGNTIEMLEAAQIINGRTVVPLRFVSENMGYSVEWHAESQEIMIYNK